MVWKLSINWWSPGYSASVCRKQWSGWFSEFFFFKVKDQRISALGGLQHLLWMGCPPMNPDPGKPSDLGPSVMDLDITFKNVLMDLDGSWDLMPHPRNNSRILWGGGNKRSSLRWAPGSERSGSFVFPWGWNFLISSVVPICQNAGHTSVAAYKSPSFANLYKVQWEESSCLVKSLHFPTWKPQNLATIVREVLVLVVWKFSQEIHGELYFFPLSFLGALVISKKKHRAKFRDFFRKFQPFLMTSI